MFGSRAEPTLHSLAPCFNEVISNENCSYYRYALAGIDQDLAKFVNESKLACNPKEGFFLKSLGKSALNKNAAKDLWSVEFESAWIDFKV